jgi:hypothetical protein
VEENVKQMRFSIEIGASKEKVWRTMWRDETFRDWANIIDPGTHMVGELKEGNEIQFISSENGYGVTSLVAKLVPGEFVLLKHRADTQDSGARERDQQWTGGEETYALEGNGRAATLTVSFGVPLELEDYFKVAYPKALERLKTLAEGQK